MESELRGGVMKTRVFRIALATLVLAGCAASPPQRWGEWIDPTIGQNSGILRGGKVLVACDTFDLSTRAQCQDDLARALEGRGVNAVAAPMGATSPSGRELEGQLAGSATAAGAKTVFVLTLTPATTSMGSGLSVGVGGFSFGRNSGAGIGLSAPVGGGWGNTGFSANGRVMDVSNGRMVWTTTFVASPSPDLGAQFRELTRNVLDAAQGAGLL
ncbi:hypothetical protein QTH90_03690 [Variovorax sp. J2P1-59]|uniref:hypothetical protein n=1 Tax=Variovorax flavidus TaxID=3053501 RepID=UPI002574DBDF|nr:hypothetical protein [Variovorax sp. J2P1-59]MDM0073468.1 hypothetical protein [Variovorax sp. J2P1-59]